MYELPHHAGKPPTEPGWYVKRTRTADPPYDSEHRLRGGADRTGEVKYSRSFPTPGEARYEAVLCTVDNPVPEGGWR